MLILCVSCGKIIGCGITEIGSIAKQCNYCPDSEKCKDETPLNTIMERRVLFIHFDNECRGHTAPIGFRFKGT